ncbi:MAG: PilZ domain-containing protein [Vicinamibacterales bacterium]
MPPAAVLIASSDLLPALEQRAAVGGEALCFSDAQPLEALEAITLHRPTLIVLERFFAATPRGAALINRIKADPGCANAEIRVLSHTGDYTRVITKPAGAPAPPAAAPAAETAPAPGPATAAAPASAPTQPTPAPSSATTTATAPAAPATPATHIDWRGTRRHPRVRLKDGLSLQIDGKDAALVDLSEGGAHVVSPNGLRPNQKLRITLALEPDARLRATVAWASFELPKGGGGARYRAGIEFNDADPRIAAYIQRNKRD